MFGPRNAAPMPLFDRLVGREEVPPPQGPPGRTLDREGLRESVRRELERMLNTRSSIPAPLLEDRPLTAIEYGMPDFGTVSAANDDDQRRLIRWLLRAVEAFEPRLRSPRVDAVEVTAQGQGLVFSLAGELVAGAVREPIVFPVVIDQQGAEVSTRGLA